MNQAIQRGLRKVGVLTAVAMTSGMAMAQTATGGPDLTALTDKVDFGTVTAAVLSIAGLLAVVYVAIKGARTVLGMLKR